MKASDIAHVLDAAVLCGGEYLDEIDVDYAFAADMMSDVLAFIKERTLFLTGMINPHTIRTAEIMDIRCVVFVRGKEVSPDVIEMAEERAMVLLSTGKSMYTSCGLLYGAGLLGCF